MRLADHFRLVAAIVGFAALVGLSPSATAAEPIVVGVVLPMTGIFSTYGKPYADALQIALDEANKQGGVDGRPLTMIVEDSQASNTVAINALNKVLLEKPAVIFGPGMGPPILAMLPTIEKSKIPTIAGPSSSSVTEKGAKYFFRSTSSDAVGKQDEARFLVDKLGKKKIGILYIDTEWGYSARDNVTAYLKSLYGMAPVTEASYQPTDKDFTAQVAQLANAGVDAIVTQGYPVDEALVTKQINQAGLKAVQIGSGSLCNAYILHLLTTEEVAGKFCDSPALLPQFDTRPQMQAFVDVYKKLDGFPPGVYAGQYGDALTMVVSIMRKVGTDPDKIRDGLASTSFDGVFGTYKSDAKGNLWSSDVIAEFMPDGTMREANRFQAN
jgi:branched-chain amino acid transport system substrate-binding protein